MRTDPQAHTRNTLVYKKTSFYLDNLTEGYADQVERRTLNTWTVRDPHEMLGSDEDSVTRTGCGKK